MMDSVQTKVDSTGRNHYIDFMRGLVIFLMLWGHCIQYCVPAGVDFFQNPVFKLIYTFHMPLFALISGYMFAFSAARKPAGDFLGGRVIALIQPAVFGGLLNFVIVSLLSSNPGAIFSTDILDTASSLWFLWSMLGSAVAVAVAIRITNHPVFQLLLIILLTPLMYALPNGDLNFFMYPYFVLGWYFFQYKDFPLLKLLRKAKGICIPLFLIMLCFYETKHYIYTTGIFGGGGAREILKINLLRFSIGLAGSVTVLILGKCFMHLLNKVRSLKATFTKGLCAIGRKSLQIYILSCSLLSWYLPDCMERIYKRTDFLSTIPASAYDFLLTPAVALLYAIALYWLVRLMEITKISRIIFGR